MAYREEEQVRLRRQRSKQAITLAMQRRWREAVVANEGIIASFPGDVDAYNRLGRAHIELGEYGPAKEAYTRATELDPYNIIAQKNLQRLSYLGEGADEADGSDLVEPQHFIEETGKAGVVAIYRPAPLKVLAKMGAGDRVYLKADGTGLNVENGRGEYVGQVEPKHGQRLIKLMDGGNRYSAAIVSINEERVTVIIREIYQDPSQAGQLSFPPKGTDSLRPYLSDKMLRRELEHIETMADESVDMSDRGDD
ncbi:MAG TPA: tetratricopeptide repeat protein [Dehalococcoidales bacterium]|nr:tetratricopeptide repeat protein [Dehalococcoidales bacterium]